MTNNPGRCTPAAQYRALVQSLLSWFEGHARDLPWRRTLDPYAIWISEVMLQQTQVNTVIPYWRRWLRELPTVRSLASASLPKVLKLWEGLGYYTRASNLRQAARIIRRQFAGRFPRSFDDLLALPGIGRYTAGAICSIAFNQPAPILDGNVIRVLTRVFGIDGIPRQKKTNARLWGLAQDLVSQANRVRQPKERNCSRLNQALMELGAVVCTVRLPDCPRCPLRRRCLAFLGRRGDQFTNMGHRPPPTARRFVAFVVQERGRFLVRQRPAGIVNAHLWEFPNIEVSDARHSIEQLAREVIGPISNSGQPTIQIKHSMTRYRITLEVFRVEPRSTRKRASTNERWCALRDLRKLAFPSAHRKILSRLTEHRKH